MKKQIRHPLQWFFLSLLIVLSAMSGGCGARPDPIALEQARTAYHQAAEDLAVLQYAPGALRDAEQVLNRAEQAWQSDQNTAEVAHLSYLTEQRVAIARARADNKGAEADWQRLTQEREQVLREARIQEADQARREAEQARREAEEVRARHEEATKQIAMLQEQLGTLQAKATSRGTVLTLGNVLFAPGKATLRAEALHNVYPLVTFMREDPRRTAIIEGYTDNVGSDKSNLDLSQQRAEAVRDFLIKNGIDAERIEARGYGEAAPVASNDTEAGRQQNRRVEIVFTN
jgi:outer membrane protein OmpA-like peptidoglycan-associated protein